MSIGKILLRGGSLYLLCLQKVIVSMAYVQPNDAESPKIKAIFQQHQQQTCWVFSHLQKSGGSSIKAILDNRSDLCTSYIYDHSQWCQVKQDFSTRVSGLQTSGSCNVIMGGYTEALRIRNPSLQSCSWFTMFRHPVSRLVSAFFYCQKRPSDLCCATNNMPTEAHVDIIAFAKHWGNFATRQFAMGFISAEDVMTYFRETKCRQSDGGKVSGWYVLKTYLENSTDCGADKHEDDILYSMLQPIRALIGERFTAVGILEEFNTSMSLFNAALGMPHMDWCVEFSRIGVKNADVKYKDEERKLLAEALTNTELKSYLDLDLLLYEHAVDVFHRQARFYEVI